MQDAWTRFREAIGVRSQKSEPKGQVRDDTPTVTRRTAGQPFGFEDNARFKDQTSQPVADLPVPPA